MNTSPFTGSRISLILRWQTREYLNTLDLSVIIVPNTNRPSDIEISKGHTIYKRCEHGPNFGLFSYIVQNTTVDILHLRSRSVCWMTDIKSIDYLKSPGTLWTLDSQ